MIERKIPVEHDGECLCPVCLVLDMNQALTDQGLDPDRYRHGIPDGVWRQLSPADLAALDDLDLVSVRVKHAASDPGGVLEDDELGGGDEPAGWPSGRLVPQDPAMPPPSTSDAGAGVAVPVSDVWAGIWARFTARTLDGQPVTVSGAVVGGPDPYEGGWVVQVRDYRGNPDWLLRFELDAAVLLVDDPADHDARAAHAVAPVFGPVARVDWLVRVPSRRNPKKGRWVADGSSVDVPDEQMALWEEHCGEGERMFGAVHRGHLPVTWPTTEPTTVPAADDAGIGPEPVRGNIFDEPLTHEV